MSSVKLSLSERSIEVFEKPETHRKDHKRPLINYEAAVWVVYAVLTIIFIIDRFYWNGWPRQTFYIGAGTAGSDRMGSLKPGPWSVKLYDLVARLSGRFDIAALNLLFFTMMRSTMAALSESWIARNVVDMSNYVTANLRLHRYNAIAMVALTLFHVWSILFPCIFSGWSAQVVAGYFEWPASERAPEGFKDANAETETMSLEIDDVYRLALMTVMLGILVPLTLRWFQTRWYVAIQLHSFVAVMFFIDIVRRHTHPHSWVLNTPFFILWLMDHAVGFFWRKETPTILRKVLSEEYAVFFWKQSRCSLFAAPKYFLRHTSSSCLERSHVFTASENRLNMDLADGHDWSVCLVVRVYHKNRKARLPGQDKRSHTQKVAAVTNLSVVTWGPFSGEISEHIRHALNEQKPVTISGGGSAAGYVLDALQMHLKLNKTKLTVLYTARDPELVSWMISTINSFAAKASFENVSIVIATTGSAYGANSTDFKAPEKTKETTNREQWGIESGCADSENKLSGTQALNISVQNCRLNFNKLIAPDNIVFFEGSGGLQDVIRRACKQKGAKFVSGAAFDKDEKKGNWTTKIRQMNCFVNRGDQV